MKTHSAKDGNKRKFLEYISLMLTLVKIQIKEQITSMI